MPRGLARYSWLIGSLAAATLLDGCRCNDDPIAVETETGGSSSESQGDTSGTLPDLAGTSESGVPVETETETDTGTQDSTDETDTGPGTGCDDDVIEAGEVCFERVNLIVGESSGAIALGDVEADGTLDILVGQLDRAIMLPGGGDGTFGDAVVLATPSGVLASRPAISTAISMMTWRRAWLRMISCWCSIARGTAASARRRITRPARRRVVWRSPISVTRRISTSRSPTRTAGTSVC